MVSILGFLDVVRYFDIIFDVLGYYVILYIISNNIKIIVIKFTLFYNFKD